MTESETLNEQLKTALGKALDNAGFKPHIKSLLEFHRQEFPFVPGDNSSEHGERYYWLSGFLNAYQEGLGDDDGLGTPLRQRQLEEEVLALNTGNAELKEENHFLKVQIRELREKIERISGNPF